MLNVKKLLSKLLNAVDDNIITTVWTCPSISWASGTTFLSSKSFVPPATEGYEIIGITEAVPQIYGLVVTPYWRSDHTIGGIVYNPSSSARTDYINFKVLQRKII